MPYSGANDPTGLQLVNPVLTGLARQYRPTGFIYDKLSVNVPVLKNTDVYPIFDPAYFFDFADVDGQVDHRAPTPEIDIKYSTDSYNCKNYRLKFSISDEERSQAHTALQLERSKLNALLSRMAIRRERRLAAALRGADMGGQFTQNKATPSTKWDATSGATIQADFNGAVKTVYNAIGKRPNTVAMTYNCALAIANEPTIQGLLKYTVNGIQMIQTDIGLLPATLFGLNVVIADGTKYNTAKEGDPISLSDIWGNSARLLYVDQNAEWGMPATVYSFKGQVRGDANPDAQNGLPAGEGFALVDQWRSFDPPVAYTRAWERVDEKVVAPGLGYELEGVLTTP